MKIIVYPEEHPLVSRMDLLRHLKHAVDEALSLANRGVSPQPTEDEERELRDCFGDFMVGNFIVMQRSKQVRLDKLTK